MEKMCALILAQAVTKSIAALSSLSHTRKLLPVSSVFSCEMVLAKTLAHLLSDHTCISVVRISFLSSFLESPPCEAACSHERGMGGFRVFHKFSKKLSLKRTCIYVCITKVRSVEFSRGLIYFIVDLNYTISNFNIFIL